MNVAVRGTSVRQPQHPPAADHLLFKSWGATKFADRANACGRFELHSSREHRSRFLDPSGERDRPSLYDNDHAEF